MRYLIPIVPALLFGLAWWAYATWRSTPMPVIAVATLSAIAAAGLLIDGLRGSAPDHRHAFSLEAPALWLMQRRVDRLVFVWTDPSAARSDDASMRQVANFFFARAGRMPVVDIVHAPLTGDVSSHVRQVAGTEPGTAILWIAGQTTGDSNHSPRIAAQDGKWTCRDFGGGMAIATACRREKVSPPVRPRRSAPTR